MRTSRVKTFFAAVAVMAVFAAVGADDAPIGVFDSGLGGLTVLERLLDVDQVNNATGLYGPDGVPDLAHERFTYLGDQANMPYGDYAAEGKSDYLRELILKDAKFLLSTNYYRCDRETTPNGTKQRVKIIVIACNTATAWGLDDVRKYLASIGDGTKVVGVIEAGVRATLDHVAAKSGSKPFALGVMATPGTIASGAYERTIRAELKARGVACEVPVINQGCAGLADAVEAGSPTADSIARSNLVSLVERYRASGKTAPIRAVILGCTHYPFVLATLEKTVAELRAKGAPFAEDFRFVDPAFYTAAECHRILRESGRLTGFKGAMKVDAFLSVANPALPPECLTPDGQLTRKFKYGRNVGSEAVTTKPVPLTRERFGDDLFKNIGRLLPRTASLIEKFGESPEGGWKSKGIVVAAPAPKDVGRFCSFVKNTLKPAGVDTIVLLVRYRYKFTSHPECVGSNALSLADVKAIKAACDAVGVKLIPKMNLLGHQGERNGVVRDGLLKGHPELDESPEKKRVIRDYCRSICPTHPDSKRIVLDLVDELVAAFGADMMHIGCDEVFEIGNCPRCRGTATAKLFADWVNGIADHLKAKGVGVMMWGDRLLDSKAMGYGVWEASDNGTSAALGKVNRDIVICDWHYSIRKAYPSVEAFADAGYKIYLCPWRYVESTRKFLEYALAHDKGQYLGVLLTTWCACEDFMDVVEGKGITRHKPDSKSAKTLEALRGNFRYLFQSDIGLTAESCREQNNARR